MIMNYTQKEFDTSQEQNIAAQTRPGTAQKLRSTSRRRLFKPVVIALLLAAVAPAAAGSNQTRSPRSSLPANTLQVRLLNAFRPIGGLGNNITHPFLNVIPGNPELAFAPLNFASGTNDGLPSGPNPRTVSDVIAGGTGADGQNAQTTDPVLSAWLYVFGQFIDHDIDLEQAPTTSPAINIVTPPGDPVFTPGTVIAMTRDTRSAATNTIVNTVAGYLDLSQLYGSTATVAASLVNADGTLKTSDNGLALPVVNGTFVSGDPRVTENPELTALTILFMREHNFWVRTLRGQEPGWTGTQLYNMARAITTAEYQNIVYTEYLPALIGPLLGAYQGYNSAVNAQVTQEFSTAAFRVGHSQVSDTQEGLDNNGNTVFTESVAQSFFSTPQIDEANGIDALLRSLGVDYSQATDVYTVAALRNLLFAGLVGGDIDELDLIAIEIQRERDVGLATLNGTRRAIGVPQYRSFAQLTPDPILQKNLATIYGSIDNVDLFMGGLAEKHAADANVGPTFQYIIASQFWRLRSGDRFYWQNEGFDSQTASMIAAATLTTLMRRDTATTANLQADLFVQAPLSVTHVKPHVAPPAVINTQGRKGPPFLNDGT
jgi:peroxidase